MVWVKNLGLCSTEETNSPTSGGKQINNHMNYPFKQNKTMLTNQNPSDLKKIQAAKAAPLTNKWNK